ncbi:DUF4332 domain-containing protein [Trichloromonas sp.]|uniref:DUF4332 domain-containing protein n=1 Tax=Trichloromonas sp. TaxID=3069249 RepID=UPI002A4536C5|nr:DUF4332 domain-containing protein [Trichloromonas sp.]
MTRLKGIEGIGEEFAARLKTIGIHSVQTLLDRGATPEGRRELAKASGIAEGLLLRWLNNADLFRIRGIGEDYADLLEGAGVDTVPELAQRSPKNLHRMLIDTNDKRPRVRQLPSVNQVKNWIDQAKQLPRIVQY